MVSPVAPRRQAEGFAGLRKACLRWRIQEWNCFLPELKSRQVFRRDSVPRGPSARLALSFEANDLAGSGWWLLNIRNLPFALARIVHTFRFARVTTTSRFQYLVFAQAKKRVQPGDICEAGNLGVWPARWGSVGACSTVQS